MLLFLKFCAGQHLAHAKIKRSVTQGDDGNGWQWFEVGASNSETTSEIGYALGVGMEHAMTNRLALTAKYIYSDFGSIKYKYHGYGYGQEVYGKQKIELDTSVLSLGINYNF